MPVQGLENPKYQLAPVMHVNGHASAMRLADEMYWSVMYADESDPIKLFRHEPDKQVELACELHEQDISKEPYAHLAIESLRSRLRERL